MTKFSGQIRLTRRETEVPVQIVRNVCSKDIGVALGIGRRIADYDRIHLIKPGAKNTADPMRIAISGGY